MQRKLSKAGDFPFSVRILSVPELRMHLVKDAIMYLSNLPRLIVNTSCVKLEKLLKLFLILEFT